MGFDFNPEVIRAVNIRYFDKMPWFIVSTQLHAPCGCKGKIKERAMLQIAVGRLWSLRASKVWLGENVNRFFPQSRLATAR
jgi:hypothetical protein